MSGRLQGPRPLEKMHRICQTKHHEEPLRSATGRHPHRPPEEHSIDHSIPVRIRTKRVASATVDHSSSSLIDCLKFTQPSPAQGPDHRRPCCSAAVIP